MSAVHGAGARRRPARRQPEAGSFPDRDGHRAAVRRPSAWPGRQLWNSLVVPGTGNYLVAFLARLHPPRAWASRSASTACSRTAASRPGPITRGVLAALGSAAIEGPVVAWVADHRKHHAFSDEEGDPHKPPRRPRPGWGGAARACSTRTWAGCSSTTQRALKTRYVPDLLADPVVSFVNRTFLWWVLAGFAVPFSIGFALGGTLMGGLSSLLWAGSSGCSSCTM